MDEFGFLRVVARRFDGEGKVMLANVGGEGIARMNAKQVFILAVSYREYKIPVVELFDGSGGVVDFFVAQVVANKNMTLAVHHADIEAAGIEAEAPKAVSKREVFRFEGVLVARQDKIQHFLEVIEVVAGLQSDGGLGGHDFLTWHVLLNNSTEALEKAGRGRELW